MFAETRWLDRSFGNDGHSRRHQCLAESTAHWACRHGRGQYRHTSSHAQRSIGFEVSPIYYVILIFYAIAAINSHASDLT